MSADGDRVVFEVERFGLAGDGRVEVAGRWFGVRGVRFMRPSLVVRTEEGERSVLATLEHKPWAAEEGARWEAAFPWKGGPIDAAHAELAVAPSIVVPLGVAAPGEAGRPRRPTLRDRLEGEVQRSRRLESEVTWLRQERERLLAGEEPAVEGATPVAAPAVDEAALDEARAAAAQARAQRDELRAERNEARARLADVEAELRRALDQRAEREDAERDTPAAGAAEVRRELAVAEHERDDALRRLSRAYRELEAATRERDEVATERDGALERAEAAERGPEPSARRRAGSRSLSDWVTPAAVAVAAVALLLLLLGLLRLL